MVSEEKTMNFCKIATSFCILWEKILGLIGQTWKTRSALGLARLAYSYGPVSNVVLIIIRRSPPVDSGLFGQGPICSLCRCQPRVSWCIGMCGFGLMCPLLPCLALTLIPVFGEIITDYCLKKISPVLMAKHSSGLVAPCLEAVNGSSWMALKQAARGKKPKRPRNKGQEEKEEEEAERVLMSFNSSQRVWCKRLRLWRWPRRIVAWWCAGRRCFLPCDLFFTEGQKLKTTPLLVAVLDSCKALPMAKPVASHNSAVPLLLCSCNR